MALQKAARFAAHGESIVANSRGGLGRVWGRLWSCVAVVHPLPRADVQDVRRALQTVMQLRPGGKSNPRSLEPLVSPEELEQSQKLVTEFGVPGGEGDRLQARLQRRAARMENWIGGFSRPTWKVDFQLAVHSSPAVGVTKQDFNDWKGQLRTGILNLVDPMGISEFENREMDP
uniref:Uncharacterized protein n=1 Tax=Sphaerodactylus townsendi TaxID=933632 RepID=A0ACB8EG65_9SAUR